MVHAQSQIQLKHKQNPDSFVLVKQKCDSKQCKDKLKVVYNVITDSKVIERIKKNKLKVIESLRKLTKSRSKRSLRHLMRLRNRRDPDYDDFVAVNVEPKKVKREPKPWFKSKSGESSAIHLSDSQLQKLRYKKQIKPSWFNQDENYSDDSE